eukprot:4899524-Pleurochrysis_carterae.AAC.1
MLLFKKHGDGSRADLVLYVDDCWYTDTGGAMADRDLQLFGARFKLTLEDEPKQFLGTNIHVSDGRIHISAKAYVLAKAREYLLKPLADYPNYDTPDGPNLVKDYETAALKLHVVHPAFLKMYQSKVSALIFAPPCARPGEAFAVGTLARALTFPTTEMDAHADRVLACMAQHADEAIEFQADRAHSDKHIAYSDSDWAVSHSTT